MSITDVTLVIFYPACFQSETADLIVFQRKKETCQHLFYLRTRHELGPSGRTTKTRVVQNLYFPKIFFLWYFRCGYSITLEYKENDTLYITTVHKR